MKVNYLYNYDNEVILTVITWLKTLFCDIVAARFMTKFDDIRIIAFKSFIRVILQFTDVAVSLIHHLNWT